MRQVQALFRKRHDRAQDQTALGAEDQQCQGHCRGFAQFEGQCAVDTPRA